MSAKDSTMSGQGSIVPTLFIGLGGTGSRIVDRIASRAKTLPNWDKQLRALTSFATIDTNELDQHRLVHIPDGNRINIASFDKVKAFDGFKRSEDRQLLGFLDVAYKPRPGSKPGAGQIRIESRFGFFYHSPDIRTRLQQIVQAALAPNNTWRQTKPNKFNVYIFCTLAGGTGSGSFLSTAYMIDSIITDQGWLPRVIGHLMLSTLMTSKVGRELHPDIHANTYAALKELEHLTKLDYQQEKDEGRESEEFVYWRDENNRDEPQRVTKRPFFLAFIHDSPAHISLPNVEAAVADAAFLQLFTPIMDQAAGELDNYEKRQSDLTRFPGELKNLGKGYTKNFGAMGATAMVLPGEELLRFCALRFAAQAIRAQITFGVDKTSPSDDRARALAKLAVDYSAPRFAAMSEEAQEEEINKAFMLSVQEMSRQDERDELLQGFWYKLIESIDLGPRTGVDEKGEPMRGESLTDRVARKLGEDREVLMNKVSIRDRSFVFLQEGVNQYVELVSRLKEDVRRARSVVDEGMPGLESAASEGESILELKLNPIAERYLVLRLLERCDSAWIPEAEGELEAARKKDLSNPKVMERLEKDEFETLQDAAKAKKFKVFTDTDTFIDARDEAQRVFRDIARMARKTFNAEIRLRQLRAIRDYLVRRSRQYFRLATKMDDLVRDLERDAQALRRGEGGGLEPLALEVEVFETLEEPRRRIWDQVYEHLFIAGGRYLTTFNREELATTISDQLKPVVREDGRVVDKDLPTLVRDIRDALLALGLARLRGAIFGEGDSPGLDLARGLELEARLRLVPDGGDVAEVPEDDIRAYETRKFRALHQLTGVLGRVNAAEAKAFDDGVEFARTRILVMGHPGTKGKAAEAFQARLESVLTESGRRIDVARWHDPRIAIVHDVELGIPLYYFKSVVDEIEGPYLDVAADERRTYHLHTDYHWEKSLPNLNPRRSEVAVGWALRAFTEGMICRVISKETGGWTWKMGDDELESLGESLSTAMYRMGELHRNKDLCDHFNRTLRDGRKAMDEAEYQAQRDRLEKTVDEMIVKLGVAEMRGAHRTELLDRPLLRAILREVRDNKPFVQSSDGAADKPTSFSFS